MRWYAKQKKQKNSKVAKVDINEDPLTLNSEIGSFADSNWRRKREEKGLLVCFLCLKSWNLEYLTCERGYFIKVLYRVYIVFGIPYDATHVHGYVEFSLESDFIIIVVFDLKFIPTCLVEKIRYNKFHFLFVCISRWVMIFE